MQEKIFQFITDNIQIQHGLLDVQVDNIETAAKLLTTRLLANGKIICVGSGRAQLLAQLATQCLLHGTTRKRPALPSVTIDPLFCNEYEQTKTKLLAQFRALASDNDIVLALNTEQQSTLYQDILECAFERQLPVVYLTSNTDSLLNTCHDAHLHAVDIPSDNPQQLFEIQTTIIHCLCSLIEYELFG